MGITKAALIGPESQENELLKAALSGRRGFGAGGCWGFGAGGCRGYYFIATLANKFFSLIVSNFNGFAGR